MFARAIKIAAFDLQFAIIFKRTNVIGGDCQSAIVIGFCTFVPSKATVCETLIGQDVGMRAKGKSGIF